MATLRLATFNAGLAVGVLPYVTERLDPVIDALGRLDVDVLFVQEFWLAAHWERLRARLADRLPHAHRPEPVHAIGAGACTEGEVRPLVACARTHCAGLTDEALARCVVAHCAPAALTMRAACLNCIAAHPVGTMDEVVGRCVGAAPGDATPGGPRSAPTPEGLIAYGGSFGTGLLARTPLDAVGRITFASTVNARGAVHARIATDLVRGGTLHLFAASLSPGGAEQPPQMDALLAWMDATAPDGPTVLLGDLNATPGSTLFRRLERAGFVFPADHDARATYASGALGTGHVSDGGWRLDHVLARHLGPGVRFRDRRVLDAPIAIDAGGRRQQTTLSDHFGVLAELEA